MFYALNNYGHYLGMKVYLPKVNANELLMRKTVAFVILDMGH